MPYTSDSTGLVASRGAGPRGGGSRGQPSGALRAQVAATRAAATVTQPAATYAQALDALRREWRAAGPQDRAVPEAIAAAILILRDTLADDCPMYGGPVVDEPAGLWTGPAA